MNKTRCAKQISEFPEDFNSGTFTELAIKKSNADTLRYQVHKSLNDVMTKRIESYGKIIPLEDRFCHTFLASETDVKTSDLKDGSMIDMIMDSVVGSKDIPGLTGVYGDLEWTIIYEELKHLGFKCGLLRHETGKITHLWIMMERNHEDLQYTVYEDSEAEECGCECDDCGDCECDDCE
jgi:hypothetical protein